MGNATLAAVLYLANRVRALDDKPEPVAPPPPRESVQYTGTLTAAFVTDRYLLPYQTGTPPPADPTSFRAWSRPQRIADFQVFVLEHTNGTGGVASLVFEAINWATGTFTTLGSFALTPVTPADSVVLKQFNDVGFSGVIPAGSSLNVRYDVTTPPTADWDLVVNVALEDA